MVKVGCGHCHVTLQMAVSQEQIDGIDDFLHVDTNSGKLKVTLIICEWVWSKWVWFFRSWGYKICFSRMN